MPIIPTVTGMIAKLTRHCQKCGHRQIVAPSKARSAVKCDRCGTDIPPVK